MNLGAKSATDLLLLGLAVAFNFALWALIVLAVRWVS